MKRGAMVLMLAGAVAGCANYTKYQPEGLTGGYTDTQLDRNIFRVTFKGNGFTSPERAQDLALLRSAEIALKNGFNYFTVIDENSRIATSVVTTPIHANTTSSATMIGSTMHGSSTTTITGGIPITSNKPRTTLTIVCFVERPKDGTLVYDARFLWDSLSKKYEVDQNR